MTTTKRTAMISILSTELQDGIVSALKRVHKETPITTRAGDKLSVNKATTELSASSLLFKINQRMRTLERGTDEKKALRTLLTSSKAELETAFPSDKVNSDETPAPKKEKRVRKTRGEVTATPKSTSSDLVVICEDETRGVAIAKRGDAYLVTRVYATADEALEAFAAA
jgi:hypothetical protein